MRIYYCLAAASALLLLLLLNPIPATLAAIPTPTPKAKSASAPREQSFVFLPLIYGSPPVPAFNPKKGVALTYDFCEDVATMGATWTYDWTTTPPVCPDRERIPMIETASDWDKTLGGNSNWIMGFNEPDLRGFSPSDAAIYWRLIEQKYPTRKLLSPAPSGSMSGLAWLVNFRNAYISFYATSPRLDGLGAHCYKWYSFQCVELIQSFIDQANAWGVPEVWVTEFSFSPTDPSSPSGALQEQQTFINWMVNDPKIKRHAWFASRINGNEPWSLPTHVTPLIDSSGQPTSFGTVYQQYQ